MKLQKLFVGLLAWEGADRWHLERQMQPWGFLRLNFLRLFSGGLWCQSCSHVSCAQQSPLFKSCQSKRLWGPWGPWHCQRLWPWVSSGCLHAEAVPCRAAIQASCWNCVEAVKGRLSCETFSPRELQLFAIEASLVHQNFYLSLPAMGCFESLWITLGLCQCLWIFINSRSD